MMKRPPLEAIDERLGGFDQRLHRIISWALNREKRVAALEAKIKSARPHVHRQQTAGTHEQDRADAKTWIENDRADQGGKVDS